MQVEFTQQQLEQLLNYLARQPWADVNPILGPLLQQLEQQRDDAGSPGTRAPALRAVGEAQE